MREFVRVSEEESELRGKRGATGVAPTDEGTVAFDAELTISSAQLTHRKVGVGPIPPAVALSKASLLVPLASAAVAEAPTTSSEDPPTIRTGISKAPFLLYFPARWRPSFGQMA